MDRDAQTQKCFFPQRMQMRVAHYGCPLFTDGERLFVHALVKMAILFYGGNRTISSNR
jgi:hypothetical protein